MTTTVVGVEELLEYWHWAPAQSKFRMSFCDVCSDWHWPLVRTDLWNVRISEQDRKLLGRCISRHDAEAAAIRQLMHGPQARNYGKRKRVLVPPDKEGDRDGDKTVTTAWGGLSEADHVAEDFLRGNTGHWLVIV